MNIRIIVAFVALLTFTGSALAQSGYLGVGALRGGMSSVPILSTTMAGIQVWGWSDSTTAAGAKLYGGYDFNQNWGIEFGYNDLGNSYAVRGFIGATPYTVTSMKVNNSYLVGTSTLPVSKEFFLMAKLGVAGNHSGGGTACVVGTCLSVGSKSRSELMYGVGVSYAFNKKWAARLEYEYFGKFSDDNFWGAGTGGATKGNAGTLSAKYTF